MLQGESLADGGCVEAKDKIPHVEDSPLGCQSALL
jgi:hypothetical protein